MLERCPYDSRYGSARCRDGLLYSRLGRYLHPCPWLGHALNSITHCCEGDRPDDTVTDDTPSGMAP